MNWLKASARLAAAMSFVACAHAEVPAEAFAVLPDEQPSISPDGKHFALIRESKGRPVVAIYDIGSPNPPVVVGSQELLITRIQWAKADALLIYGRANKKVGLWDPKGLVRTVWDANAVLVNNGYKQVRLTAYVNVKDIDLDDPDNIYVEYGRGILRVNVHSGAKSDLVMLGKLPNQIAGPAGWFFDGHGNVVARTNYEIQPPYEVVHGLIKLEVQDKGDWRELAQYPYTIDYDDGLWGVATDGNALIRNATDPKRTASVTRVDLTTGAETALFNDPVYDDLTPITNEWTGRVEGFAVRRDTAEYHYFDPKLQALQKGIQEAFPGLSAYAASADRNWDKVIVRAEGPRTPPTYYLLDRTTHQATSLAASYPQLDESMLGEVKPYLYKARDGLEIHAYLTLPPGKPAKNLPLIVMPHGGPDARDDTNFDWWAQFLANRGYAVLKPNFRGSSGYGRAFTEAGLHQWGLKMQDDITDGVMKVIADGIADPKRICIVGASYGGYAAMAGATLTAHLYACAISYAGVTHLPNILGYSKLQNNQSLTNGSFWVTRIGDGFKDIERLKATSPALQAERARAPMLLIHSELDNTVPVTQSEVMEKELKRAGKPVEFIRIPGDDHYLSLASTRLVVLQAMARFLKAHIGN